MINKVILMGRLTADPELKQTQSGISCLRCTIAINRQYKADNGERQADFINVVAWRQTAEFISKYFSKGKMIIVEGSLRNNNYTDQNGVKHYAIDVHADNVAFGESKSSGDSTSVTTQTTQAADTPVTNTGGVGDLGDFEDILSDGEPPF